MAFKDDFQNLIGQILQRKTYITNEEMTKQSLIIPFIKALGYDAYNPLEVHPEFPPDLPKIRKRWIMLF